MAVNWDEFTPVDEKQSTSSASVDWDSFEPVEEVGLIGRVKKALTPDPDRYIPGTAETINAPWVESNAREDARAPLIQAEEARLRELNPGGSSEFIASEARRLVLEKETAKPPVSPEEDRAQRIQRYRSESQATAHTNNMAPQTGAEEATQAADFDIGLQRKFDQRMQARPVVEASGVDRIRPTYDPTRDRIQTEEDNFNALLAQEAEAVKANSQNLSAPVRGFARGSMQSVGLGAGALAYMGDAIDNENLQKFGMEWYRRYGGAAQATSRAPEFLSIQNSQQAADWIGENVGYTAYQAVEALASFGVGGLIGKQIGKEAAFGAAVAFLNNERQTLGSVYGEAVEEAKRTGNPVPNLMQVLVGATASAVIDTAADKMGLDKALAGNLKGNFFSRMGRALPGQMAVQGGTEALQVIPENLGANTLRGFDETVRQMINEGAVGALGGAGPAIAQGFLGGRQAPQPTLADITSAPTVDQAIAATDAYLSKTLTVDDILGEPNAAQVDAGGNQGPGVITGRGQGNLEPVPGVEGGMRDDAGPSVPGMRADSSVGVGGVADEALTGPRTFEQRMAGMTQDAEAARTEAIKAQQLDQLQAESRLPAALFDAERNDRIAVAAGRDGSVPTAMQQAFAGAKQGKQSDNKAKLRAEIEKARAKRAQPNVAAAVQKPEQPPQAQPVPLAATPIVDDKSTVGDTQSGLSMAGKTQTRKPWEMSVEELIAHQKQRNAAKIDELQRRHKEIADSAPDVGRGNLTRKSKRDSSGLNAMEKWNAENGRKLSGIQEQIANLRQYNDMLDTAEGRGKAAAFHKQEVDKAISRGDLSKPTNPVAIRDEISTPEETANGTQTAQTVETQAQESQEPAAGIVVAVAQPIQDRGAVSVSRPPDQTAQAGDLFVTFGGKRYSVESIEDASRKWEAFRDSTGAGVSDLGNGVPIFDQNGKQVAYVSYNGKVWAGDTEDLNAEPIYTPADQVADAGKTIAVSQPKTEAKPEAAPAAPSPFITYTTKTGQNVTLKRKDADGGIYLLPTYDAAGNALKNQDGGPLLVKRDSLKAPVAQASAVVKESLTTAKGREHSEAPASKENAPNVSKPDDTQANAILDAAQVTGRDRLEAIEKFRAGTYSLDDLKAAYPAKASRGPKASKEWVNEGKTAADLVEKKAARLGEELGGQTIEAAFGDDFAADDLPAAVKQWADDERVPADTLRQSMLKTVEASELPKATKKRIRDALNPAKKLGEKIPPNDSGAEVAEQERAVYDVNEPDGITGDLFQGTAHELPEDEGKNLRRPRQTAAGRNRAAPGPAASVLAVREAPDAPGVYHVSAQLVTVGERQLPVETVNSWNGAAQAFAHLTRYAVEHLDGLVTDKNGKPLAIIGAFKGAPTQTVVYPQTVMMELARIDGAANLWLSHNHPSGLADLSDADRRMSRAFRDILSGTNITYRGMSAMARTGDTVKWTNDDYDSGSVDAAQPAIHRVPIVERELVESNPQQAVSSPSAAKRIVADLAKERPGIVFLSAQHDVTAFVPFDPQEMGELRSGDRLMRLIRAAAKSGAVGALVAMPDGKVTREQFGNLRAALGAIDVRVLDGIRYQSDGGVAPESLAEKGEDDSPTTFFSRDARGSGLARLDAQAVLDRIAPTFKNLPRIHLLDAVSQAPDELAADIEANGVENSVAAAVHDGEIFVFINHLADEEHLERVLFEHEVTHYGLFGTFGGTLNARLNGLYLRNKELRRRANELRKQFGLKSNVEAIEEVLADMPAEEIAKLTGWNKVVLAVRDWLAAHGFEKMAARMTKLLGSDEQAAAIEAVNMVRLAREFAKNGKPGNRIYSPTRYANEAAEGGQADTPVLLDAIETPVVSGADGEGLSIFVAEVNAPEIAARIGNEKSVRRDGAIEVTLGEKYGRGKEATQGGRYIYRGSGGKILGAVNVTTRGRDAVVSNIYVVPSERRRGIATILVNAAKKDHKNLKVDSSMTESGAELFGYTPRGEANPSNPDIRYSRSGQQPPSGSILPHTASPASYSPPAETFLRELQRKLQDNLNRWTVVQNDIAEKGGKLTEDNNVYRAMERFPKRVGNAISAFRTNTVEPLLQRVSDGGFDLDDIASYLYAKHAPERNARVSKINPKFTGDNGSGMTNDQAKTVLDELQTRLGAQFAEFESIAAGFQAITDERLNLLVRYGVMSPEQAQAYRDAFSNYVPLKGFEGVDEEGNKVGSGFSNPAKLDKRALGRVSRAANIIENITRDFENAIVAAEKANVGKVLEQFMKDNPDTIGTVDSPPKTPVLRSNGLVGQIDAPYDKEKEVRFLRDGKPVRIQLDDPLMLQGYNRLWDDGITGWMKIGYAFNGFLRQMYTQKNPAFFFINPVRDVQQLAMYGLGEGGPKLVVKAGKNWPLAWNAVRNAANKKNAGPKWQAILDEYQKAGGPLNHAWSSTIETQKEMMTAALVKLGIKQTVPYLGKRKATQALGAIWNIPAWAINTAVDVTKETRAKGIKAGAHRALVRTINNTLFEIIGQINFAFENASRLAMYQAARESGMSPKEAAHHAANVTVNFDRQGEFGPQMKALYLFSNAAVQGSATVLHSLSQSPHRKQVWSAAAAMAALGFMFGLMDDEDDDLISESERKRWYVIRIGSDRITIPKVYGWSFFGDIGRSMAALAKSKHPGHEAKKQWIELLDSFMGNFSPFGNPFAGGQVDLKNAVVGLAPTMARVPLMVAANKGSFGGPVMPESEWDKGKPDSEKLWRKTKGTVYDNLAKWMNDATGGNAAVEGMASVSPETLKLIWYTAVGGAGRTVEEAVSAKDTGKIPVIKQFYRQQDIDTYRQFFYRSTEDAKKALEDYRRVRKLGGADALVFKKENDWLIKLGSQAENYNKAMTGLRNKEDSIRLNKDMAEPEKKIRLKEVEAQQINLVNRYRESLKH